jgi:hypothetical protein
MHGYALAPERGRCPRWAALSVSEKSWACQLFLLQVRQLCLIALPHRRHRRIRGIIRHPSR